MAGIRPVMRVLSTWSVCLSKLLKLRFHRLTPTIPNLNIGAMGTPGLGTEAANPTLEAKLQQVSATILPHYNAPINHKIMHFSTMTDHHTDMNNDIHY